MTRENIEYVQTIPLELVGRNKELRVLKRPFKGDLPGADEARYTDDYLRQLDLSLPVEQVFGKVTLPLAEDFSRRLYWSVGNTPFENTESEDVLRGILFNSVGANSWQPYIWVAGEGRPERIIAKLRDTVMEKHRYTGPGYLNPDPIGMATRFDLVDNGKGIHFAEPSSFEDMLILVPTEHLARYVQANFERKPAKKK